MNIPPYGDLFRKLNLHFEQLKVIAQDIPNRTVKVLPGIYWKNDNILIEYQGEDSQIINIVSTQNYAKFIIVCINDFNKLSFLNGAESNIQPELPEIPINFIPLALIYLQYGDLIITNSMIYDIRPFINIGLGSKDHNSLMNRNGLNQHSIESIENLKMVLDSKISDITFNSALNSLNTLLTNKSDIDGTTNTIFKLNKSFVGVPSSDCSLLVNRGSLPSVGFKWNETLNVWEYTDDGITWTQLKYIFVPQSSDIVYGTTKLSLPPDNNDPIAVGKNDPVLFTTEIEKQSVLDHITNLNDPHETVKIIKQTDDIINYNNLSLNLKCKLCEVDENKTISGLYVFNPPITTFPFIIGENAKDQFVEGLNADKLDGYNSSDFIMKNDEYKFVSSIDATNQIYITDVVYTDNKYLLTVENGILKLTLI